MRISLLHRRLCAGMSLAALLAFAAGEGPTPTVLATGAGLLLALFWQASPGASAWIERATRIGVLLIFAAMMYISFVLVADFMPAVMGMLLFLLVGESLRALEARNDMRLYSLSFALLIAATAYYPGLLFAFAFVAYVALTTLAMMVGFLRREAEGFRVPHVRMGRSFLAATAALSGLTVVMSVLVFVVFPRLPRQWNVQGRRGAGEQMVGFGDEVSIGEHGGRLSPNPQIAFRVEFPGAAPLPPHERYFRGRSFDRFDGVRWTRSGWPAVPATGWRYRGAWRGPLRTARIYGGPPGANVLFGMHPVLNVVPRSAIRARFDPTGDLAYAGTDAPVYTVSSLPAAPTEESLREESGRWNPSLRFYLQLPADLPPRIGRLADSLTAPHAGRAEKARAVERWLRTEFGYTLDLPRNEREATLESFLFRRKQGHCEYFSTAMAVMLRSAGIPARNVTGFLGGEWNQFGTYLAVTENDAHSWVEVWFPGAGWVPFDPTPPSRAGVVSDETEASWAWPARLWLDGLEHRWYKWVLDYNLDKQLALFRGVGDMFSGRSGPRETRRMDPRELLPWVAAAVALASLVVLLRRRRAAPLPREARAYLALRRAYDRAGRLPADGERGPLAMAEALERERAPGARDAARVVELYLRARFAGEEIGEDGRREMEERSAAARQALRREKRRPAGV